MDAALGALRSYCGWLPFPVRTETLTLSAFGARSLLLPTLRLLEVQELSVRFGREPAHSFTAEEAEDVEWDTNGVLYLPGRKPWPHRLRGVTVKFRHGYELGEVADLVGTVLDVASRSSVNPFGRTAYKVGERQENFQAGAGGLVTGTRPLGEELSLWDAYSLGTRTTEGF